MRIDSNSIIQVNALAMDVSDPYETSTGLILLAYESKDVLSEMIAQNGIPKIFASQEEYLEFLNLTRSDGYLSMTIKKEVAEIASPIIFEEKVIAAVGVYMPKYKFITEYKENVIKNIIVISQEISNSLK
jgi:DNA-binding IclR family transcriptional regulator